MQLYYCGASKLRSCLKVQLWVKVMEEEIQMSKKNNTLENLPRDKETIGVKWINKIKLNLDGTIQK